jgi:hypothetical protein
MKTFSIGSWTSLGRLVWHGDLILGLAFILQELPFLLKVSLFWIAIT